MRKHNIIYLIIMQLLTFSTGQQTGDGEEAAISDQRESVMSKATGSWRGAQKGKDSASYYHTEYIHKQTSLRFLYRVLFISFSRGALGE